MGSSCDENRMRSGENNFLNVDVLMVCIQPGARICRFFCAYYFNENFDPFSTLICHCGAVIRHKAGASSGQGKPASLQSLNS